MISAKRVTSSQVFGTFALPSGLVSPALLNTALLMYSCTQGACLVRGAEYALWPNMLLPSTKEYAGNSLLQDDVAQRSSGCNHPFPTCSLTGTLRVVIMKTSGTLLLRSARVKSLSY